MKNKEFFEKDTAISFLVKLPLNHIIKWQLTGSELRNLYLYENIEDISIKKSIMSNKCSQIIFLLCPFKFRGNENRNGWQFLLESNRFGFNEY